MILKFLRKLYSPYKIQSFTYYIPGPPPRKSGYREKHFDKLFYQFINLGHEIISFKTVPHTGADQSGMWIVCLVRATNKSAEKIDLEEAITQDFELELETE